MKALIFCMLMLSSTIVFAQGVGINNDNSNADASAILDVKSTTTGLLIPRMTMTERDAIASPATSLLIYQTDNSPGFYFFDGLIWRGFASNHDGWKLTGNSGTSPTTNFLGTIDAQDLVFRTNNTEYNRLTSGGNFGLHITNPSAILEVNANANTADGIRFTKAAGTASGDVLFIGSGVNTVDNLLEIAYGNSFANSAMVVKNNTGYVGLGVPNPAIDLDVAGDVTFRGGTLHIWPDDPASQEGAQINLSKHGSSANGPAGAWAIDVYQNDFRILNNDFASPVSEFVRINEAGNFGIGTVSPAAKLEVVGDIALNSPFKFKVKNAADGDNYLMYEPTFDGLKLNGYDAVFISTSDPGNATAGQDLVVRNGRVGINTNTPSTGLLHVNGFYSDNFGTDFVYYANNGSPNFGGACCAGVIDISIFATHRVVATEFDAFSDARIKNIIGLSNAQEDLETIRNIEITNYRMKDALKGNKLYKKVIAQQVEQVYPAAISKTTDIIPDIYQMANADAGLIQIQNELKTGDKVKLIYENTEELATVVKASKSWIMVDNELSGKVFVYGKEVNDFRTVDYEAISMLNVSATQELLRKVEALEKENAAMKEKLQDIDELKAEVNAIKQLLNSSADNK